MYDLFDKNMNAPFLSPIDNLPEPQKSMPEPRNGVRANGSGRLSSAPGREPSETGPDPTAPLPRRLGQGIPALRTLRGQGTQSRTCDT